MTARPQLIRALAAGALLVSLPVAVFVGVRLAGGGEDEEVPVVQAEPTIDVTPEPPGSPYPTPDASQPSAGPVITPNTPDFIEISGVQIPIPGGTHYLHQTCCELRELHWIWNGDSNYEVVGSDSVRVGIQFDDFGLLYANVKPEEQNLFEPTLDALWMLTQLTADPSPGTVLVEGASVPMPEGSFYSSEEGPADAGSPTTYIVRLNHSVIWIDSRGSSAGSVAEEDATKFEATLTALDSASGTD